MNSKFRLLNKIYNDPNSSGSFGGVERLWKSARRHPKLNQISRREVANFLKGVNAYTLHRPIRRRYKREPTVVGGIDDQWQADLADMNQVAKFNRGYRYLLTVIDCFSRYAWVIPVRTKDAKSLVDAFQKLFNEEAHPRKPNRLQTDKGKEFVNAPVQKVFQDFNIKHFSTESDNKAAMVERFNRTLKSKIFAYFTATRTQKYLDVLPKLVRSYNRSIHRSIGKRPVDVNKTNEKQLWRHLYGSYAGAVKGEQRSKRAIEPNETVRISKMKSIFDKGYLPNWSSELFKVVTRQDSSKQKKRPLYKLKDYMDEAIAGRFYPEEIQSVRDTGEYEVEQVLHKRKNNQSGERELFVKWKGWPKKFNSWIPETNLLQ